MAVNSPDFRPVHDVAHGPVDHRVCLDFANTANRPDGRTPVDEKLGSYADLVAWAERMTILPPAGVARLVARASADGEGAERVVAQARALREAIYHVFASDPPAADDIDVLGRWAAKAASERRLVPAGDGWAFAWSDSDALDSVLWPVAFAAAELLVSEDRVRVKPCAADTCNWLFLDRSRNRSRRWCDMKDCGNRAKAKRFQARRRGSAD